MTKHGNAGAGKYKPRNGNRTQPIRVHETATEKKSSARQTPYESKKNQSRSKSIDDQVQGVVQGVARHARHSEQTDIPPKTDKVLGSGKNTWCEFHKAFKHDVENYIVLGYQLSGLMKVGLLQDYLVGGQEKSKQESSEEEQRREVPIHGEINTISGGCFGGGCTAS